MSLAFMIYALQSVDRIHGPERSIGDVWQLGVLRHCCLLGLGSSVVLTREPPLPLHQKKVHQEVYCESDYSLAPPYEYLELVFSLSLHCEDAILDPRRINCC